MSDTAERTIILTAPEDIPRIDPHNVPDYVYDLICADLKAAITLARKNPEYRSRYEKWRAQRKAGGVKA